MQRATWKGAVLAEAPATVRVDGYHYFPDDAVRWEHLRESDRTSVCAWKGVARYYDVVVGDDVNRAAAWSYPEPSPAAREIAGHVGFWQGVRVAKVADGDAPAPPSRWGRLTGLVRRPAGRGRR